MAISFRGGGGVSGTGMQYAMISEVRAYWEALRDGPQLPLRAQIDPRGIEGALEGAFILERIAPGIARFRLAGMQLVELIGMEVRGMPVSALIDPSGRQRLAAGLEQVFTSPAVLDLRLEAERGIGKPSLTARMIVLPLRRDTEGAGLALGCLATEGEIGRRPRRFFIANAMVEPLRTADTATLPRSAPPPMALAGMAEPPALFKGKPAASERPYLRLVRQEE